MATAAARVRAAWVLSALILVLMVVASAGGLWIEGLYQDPAAAAARFRASDLMTLVAAVPALGVALWWSRRGSTRAELVWGSMLAYALYSYAFYAFGAAFNDFFLVHVALFSLATFALVFFLAGVDADGIGARFRERRSVRWVSGFLTLLAVSLGTRWAFESLQLAITGAAPEESLLVNRISDIHLAYVLDLALLVPEYALAAVLLWRRAPWGFVLATVLLVSGVFHQLNYMAALVFQAAADVPGATAFDPVEPAIAFAFLGASAVMLASAPPVAAGSVAQRERVVGS
jgi:hypothetical protein